jgi:O-antigen ligase
VAVCVIAVCVASEYKWRNRSDSAAVSGQADIGVLLEIATYAAVGAFLALALGSPPRWRRTSPLLVARWAFVGYMATSSIHALYPTLSVVRGGQVLVVAALGQAVASRASTAHLVRLAHGFLILLVCSIFVGFAHQYPRPKSLEKRFNWLYLHPIWAANFCAVALVMGVALMARQRRIARGTREPGDDAAVWPFWVYAGVNAFILLALVLTKTRGSLAAFLAAAALYVLLTARNGKRRTDLLAGILVVLSVVVITLGATIFSYLARGESAQKLATLNSRTQLWSLAWSAFKQKWLFGYGLSSVRGLFLAQIGLGGGHNALISVIVDFGVVGLVLWAVFLFLLVRTQIRLLSVARTPFGAPLLLAFSMFFAANCITTDGIGAPANIQFTFLMLCCGWTMMISRERGGGWPEPKPRPAAWAVPDRIGSTGPDLAAADAHAREAAMQVRVAAVVAGANRPRRRAPAALLHAGTAGVAALALALVAVVGVGVARDGQRHAVGYPAYAAPAPVVASTAPAPASTAPVAFATDASVETDPTFLAAVLPNPVLIQYKLGSDGGFGTNIGTQPGQPWNPGFQQPAEYAIINGLATHQRDAVDNGWRMLDFAFLRQDSTGKLIAAEDEFNASAALLAAAVRAILFVEQEHDLATAADVAHAKALEPKVAALARWVASPAIWKQGTRNGAGSTYHRFQQAVALALSGQLLHDTSLVNLARTAVVAGMSAQQPNGMFPERGGPDTGYQMIAITYLERWLAYDPTDPVAAGALLSLRRGIDWEQDRNSGGVLSTDGNTRTGGTELGINGKPKKPDPTYVVRAICYWAVAASDDHALNTCHDVSDVYFGKARTARQ